MLTESAPILLEVGAGRTLCTLAKRHLDKSASQTILNSLPHPQDDTPSDRFILNTLGQLWLAGAKIDWNSFHGEETVIVFPYLPILLKNNAIGSMHQKKKILSVTVNPQFLGKKSRYSGLVLSSYLEKFGSFSLSVAAINKTTLLVSIYR